MKCLFKKHKFKHCYDVVIGGTLGRHLICENCYIEYAILWHVDKPHKPTCKAIRIKIIREGV